MWIFLSAGTKKSGRCRSKRWLLAEVRVYYINYYIIRLEDWVLCIAKLNDLVSDDEISPLL